MKTLATMTNAAIVKAYEANSKRQLEINLLLIKAGHGSLRFSDMREDPSLHPLIPEYLRLTDEAYALQIEASLRYGPGLISISHLVVAQGGRYRRQCVDKS